MTYITVAEGMVTSATVTTDPPLKYENPPGPVSGRRSMVYQLSLMALEPPDKWGQWVRVNTYTGANSGQVAKTAAQKLRKVTKIPDGRWEFRSGPLPEGEQGHGVWARYLGPAEGKAAQAS